MAEKREIREVLIAAEKILDRIKGTQGSFEEGDKRTNDDIKSILSSGVLDDGWYM